MLSLKDQIVNFVNDHPDKSKRFITGQLKEKKFEAWINYVLKNIREGTVHKPPKKRGPQRICFSKNEKRKLKRLVEGKVAPSLRSLAAKFGCHREVIKRILGEMGFNKKKRTEKQEVSQSQATRQEERLARALDPRRGSLRPRRGWCIVMDDESYFGLSRHSTSSFYYQENKEVPTNIKFKEKTKFESKLMV